MDALTIWQPWASLIIARAKPFEFRNWSYLDRAQYRRLLRQRLVIHAGVRPARRNEILRLIRDIEAGGFAETAIVPDIALPLLHRWSVAPGMLPIGAGLGTAILGEPVLPPSITGLNVTDSDRGKVCNWGWPLTEIEPWQPIVPMRGHQGFWHWPAAAA